MHLRRNLVALGTFSALLLASMSLGAPAYAAACGTMTLGSGSSADPWQVWNAADIASIETGATCSGPGGSSYFIQMADIVKTTITPINQSSLVRYDGNYHSVTISGVTNFAGLFTNTNNDTITRLSVLSSGSTLATDKGWLADTDTGSTFSFIVTNGSISDSGGGIVGRNAKNTTITDSYTSGASGNGGGGLAGAIDNTANGFSITIQRSHTSGAIGVNGGGLVGATWSGSGRSLTVSDSYSTGSINDNGGGIAGAYTGANGGGTISLTRTFSTGAISGFGAGGLIGAYADSNGDPATITDSFTTGAISGTNAGGVLGREALSVGGTLTISNTYTTGNITGTGASGMVGNRTTPAGTLSIINSYTSGSSSSTANGFISNGTATVTNSYSEAANSTSGWSDTHASTYLTGTPSPNFGTKWGTCLTNQPYFIAGFYPRNPCLQSPTVTLNVSGATPTTLTRPADGNFTTSSTYRTDPLSYVSIMNDTTTATVGGTSCAASTDCRLPDVMQNAGSGATVTASGAGTVKIMRYDSTTARTTQLGTLTLNNSAPPPSGGGSDSSSTPATTPSAVSSPNPTPTPSATPSLSASATPVTKISASIKRNFRSRSEITVTGTTTGLRLGTELTSYVREDGQTKAHVSKPARVRWDGRFSWVYQSKKPITVYFVAPDGVRSALLRG